MSNPVAGLEPVIELWEWQAQALCREASPDMFFHPEGERGNQRRSRDDRAKAVCDSCPVLRRCREHALASREPYGVWGGMTEDERIRILNQRELAS